MNRKVISINIKSRIDGERGIPKLPVKQATVSIKGVGDDHNNYRYNRKKNTLDRAVLLYTLDKLDELKQEGWDLNIGDLGENITLNIPYNELIVGKQIKIGDLLIEVTEECKPCNNLSVLPCVGKERINEFIITMKGRRGMYAKVLQEGTIRVEDSVSYNAH